MRLFLILLVGLTGLIALVLFNKIKSEGRFDSFFTSSIYDDKNIVVLKSKEKSNNYLLSLAKGRVHYPGFPLMLYTDSEELGRFETKFVKSSYIVSVYFESGNLFNTYSCSIKSGEQRWETIK